MRRQEVLDNPGNEFPERGIEALVAPIERGMARDQLIGVVRSEGMQAHADHGRTLPTCTECGKAVGEAA